MFLSYAKLSLELTRIEIVLVFQMLGRSFERTNANNSELEVVGTDRNLAIALRSTWQMQQLENITPELTRGPYRAIMEVAI